MSLPAPGPASAPPSLDAKVAFLRSLCGPHDAVVETHFAWVFLVGDHAWKLRKPVQRDTMDYRSLEARHRGSLDEIRLNRRLAPRVYLRAAPLVQEPVAGRLVIDGEGQVVDWLVGMRRLDRAKLLDARLRSGDVPDDELLPLVRLLVDFYATRQPVIGDGREFRLRIARQIESNAAALRAAGVAELEELAQRQRAFLDTRPAMLTARATAGCVVEAHGDLRPEHIFLEHPPEVIDCLEFDRDLRVLDRAEELCFLELECARAGRPSTGRRLLRACLAELHDQAPEPLLHFYRSHRAATRAKLYAWRAREPNGGTPEDWMARAHAYVLSALHDARLSLA